MFNIKKQFFKRELKRLQAEIWNQEFGRYTTLYKREKTRQMLDSGSDVLNRLKANPNTPKEEIAKVEAQMAKLKSEVDFFDIVLDGGKHQDGENEMQDIGINNRLEALVEKRELTKNFIKLYC
jgi:hypothetical protein